MAIPDAYLSTVGNLTKMLDALQSAGVPSRVTFEFLKTLGFKSSNDRAVIGVLKSIGFLDSNGTPTDLYRRFRDRGQGGHVLAQALRSAYSDIFLANTKANELSVAKLKDVFAAKTSKGERVVGQMAATFSALAKAADFTEGSEEPTSPAPETPPTSPSNNTPPIPVTKASFSSGAHFGYNIQIILPTTTDVTVYNAIFQSLRENLF